MGIELNIKKGETHLDNNQLKEAISCFSSVLKESPDAFIPLIKRSIAYQKSRSFDLALADVERAIKISKSRGNRANLGLASFRKGLISLLQDDVKTCLIQFEIAEKYGYTDQTLPIWKLKAEKKAKVENITVDLSQIVIDPMPEDKPKPKPAAAPAANTKAKQDVKAAPKEVAKPAPAVPSAPSTTLESINQHAPLKIKIREDWYQSSANVTITIFAKNVDKEKVNVSFTSSAMSISFPTDSSSEYNYHLEPLYDEIIASESSIKVFGTKVEVYLKKKNKMKWSKLEKDEDTLPTSFATKSDEPIKNPALSYPSSSKKKVNWNSLAVEEGEEEKEDFFQSLYGNADDDTKRAMMKSYIESNGTSLSTNWSDVESKTFETTPPSGMVAKKWEQ